MLQGSCQTPRLAGNATCVFLVVCGANTFGHTASGAKDCRVEPSPANPVLRSLGWQVNLMLRIGGRPARHADSRPRHGHGSAGPKLRRHSGWKSHGEVNFRHDASELTCTTGCGHCPKSASRGRQRPRRDRHLPFSRLSRPGRFFLSSITMDVAGSFIAMLWAVAHRREY
jgi:hypothetical protein